MAVLERVPLARISQQALKVRPERIVLAAIAGLLYVIGWLTAKAIAVLWIAAVWTIAAVQVGWQDARQSTARRKANRGA